MSESYITTDFTPQPRAEALEDAPRTGVRFTPLRSAIVVRDRTANGNTGETLSPLVPVRRGNA